MESDTRICLEEVDNCKSCHNTIAREWNHETGKGTEYKLFCKLSNQWCPNEGIPDWCKLEKKEDIILAPNLTKTVVVKCSGPEIRAKEFTRTMNKSGDLIIVKI